MKQSRILEADMDCGCKHGTKKVSGANASKKTGGENLFGGSKRKLTVTKQTSKKATRMTFAKK